jgi:hypothetical protein
VYVINFISEGVSAKIVLRRGTLQLITEPCRTGFFGYILDSQGQVCKSENSKHLNTMASRKFEASKDFSSLSQPEIDSFVGVYHPQTGKVYPADSTNGLIHIPFTPQSFDQTKSGNAKASDKKVILFNKGYCYLPKKTLNL